MKFIKGLFLTVITFFWGGVIIIAFTDLANEIFNDKLALDFSPFMCGLAGIAVGGITIFFAVMGYKSLFEDIPKLKDKIDELNRTILHYERELNEYKKDTE